MSLKSPLSEGDMTARAIEVHREMVRRETRCPGDTENAMRRIESMSGLDYWAQWQCRYRKQITAEFAQRIMAVWATVLERSVAADLAAIKTEQASLGAVNADPELASLLAEAETLLAKIQARKGGMK